MNEKALKTLEYHKITERLEAHADSEGGRAYCHAITPSADINLIRKMQSETSAALSRLLKKGSISFSSAHDVSVQLKRLELGGILNASELLKIASLLENTATVKKYSKKERENEQSDCLDELFDILIPVESLSHDIRR